MNTLSDTVAFYSFAHGFKLVLIKSKVACPHLNDILAALLANRQRKRGALNNER